jgi:hypothetical protein
MDTPKGRPCFKVATLRNPRDGEPKVVTYTIDQLVRTVRQAPPSDTTFEAYHRYKSEEKRLTAEARAAREAGDMERAKDLKARADTYALAVDRTKFGLAIMPFIFKEDITSKTDGDNRPRRDNSRITHFSLLMLDAESNTTTEEFHQVLRDYEYVLWPTITHTPSAPRYRIVLFPAEPLSIADAQALISRIDARLPARNDPNKKLQNLDPTCADVGRLMFLPKWLANHPEKYSIVHNTGALITATSFPVTREIQAVIDCRVAAAEEHRSKVATESMALLKSAPAGDEPLIVTVDGKDWLNPNAYFETKGGFVRLADVTRKIGGVRCRFHNDVRGSEFIAPNMYTGRPQFVCTKCRISIQMAPATSPDSDAGGDSETDTAAFDSLVSRARGKRPAGLKPAALAKKSTLKTEVPADLHYFDARYLPDICDIVPDRGVLFVRSPKGTGKTQALYRLVEKARTKKQSILLLTHRVSLARNLSVRLGLANYQDLEDGTLTDFSVVCVNSLTSRLEESKAHYDIVIVDESEQVLRNLLSSTLERNLSDVFRKILLLLQNAKSIVCLDADLSSELTIELIVQMRDAREETLDDDYTGIINEYKIGNGKIVRSLPNRHQLLGEIARAVEDGKKIFVACSTARAATVIGEILKAQGKRTLIISSQTNEDPDVVAFLRNPNDILRPGGDAASTSPSQEPGAPGAVMPATAPASPSAGPYDAVVASPSLQTGFSIDVPYFDAIYGWFQSVDGITFQDYDQALSRVRHCENVTVWIQETKGPPRIDPPEVFIQRAIHKEMKSRKTLPLEKHALTEGERLWVRIEGLINHLTAVWSYQRDVQFKGMKRGLGFAIAEIERNEADQEAGKLLWADFKDAGPDYAAAVFDAVILDPDEYLEIMRKNQKTKAEHLALMRHRIAAAIPEALTVELVAQALEANLLETVTKARSLIVEDAKTREHFDLEDRERQHIAFTRVGHRTFEHELLVKHLSKAVSIEVETFYDQLARGEEIEIPVSLMDQVVDAVEQRPVEFRLFFGLRVETISKAVARLKAAAEVEGAAWTPEIEAETAEKARQFRRKRVWDGTFKKVGLPLSKAKRGPRGRQVAYYYIDPENPEVALFMRAIERPRSIRAGVAVAFAGIEPPLPST